MVIKLNEWTPDTCAAGEKPCRVSIRFDTDQPTVPPEIVAYFRVCSAHVDPDLPVGKLLWADGNWKDLAAYYAYQVQWFRWFDLQRWNTRRQLEPEIGPPPSTIAGFTEEPATPGSVLPPSANEIAALNRFAGWVRRDNNRKNIAARAIRDELNIQPDDEKFRISWTFSGAGEGRTLQVAAPIALNNQQRSRIENLLAIQFGTAVTLA